MPSEKTPKDLQDEEHLTWDYWPVGEFKKSEIKGITGVVSEEEGVVFEQLQHLRMMAKLLKMDGLGCIIKQNIP